MKEVTRTRTLKGDASEGTLSIRIKEGCVVGGQPREVGEVIECGRMDALYLVQIGRATIHAESPKFGMIR
jgi:hypothetical protein